MMKMPVDDGQEQVTAVLKMDLQLFAEEAGTGGGESAGSTGDAGAGDVGSGADASGADVSGGTDFDGAGPGVVDQGDGDDVPGAVKSQSPEANRAFAEMRKQKEAAEKSAREKVQRERDAYYAERFGESHGIFTEAQYMQALERERKQKAQADQERQAQLPNQIYQQAIQEGYDPKVAKLLADNAQKDLKMQAIEQQLAADKKARLEEKKQAHTQMLAKKIDRDHKSLLQKYGDLVPATLEELDEDTRSLVVSGVPLKAAWLQVHEDEVLEFAKRGGANKAMKNLNSKSHLQTEQSGAGDFGTKVELTPEQLRVWKAFGYKGKEAQQRAAKYQKRGK